MTKTKFNVSILKTGNNNDSVLKLIAAHNEGKTILACEDFYSFATCERALFPSIRDGFYIESGDENGEMRVTEDNGKTWTLIIQEITVEELKEELA